MWARRVVSTRVLPVPAPASTSTAPSTASTARHCASLRLARCAFLAFDGGGGSARRSVMEHMIYEIAGPQAPDSDLARIGALIAWWRAGASGAKATPWRKLLQIGRGLCRRAAVAL